MIISSIPPSSFLLPPSSLLYSLYSLLYIDLLCADYFHCHHCTVGIYLLLCDYKEAPGTQLLFVVVLLRCCCCANSTTIRQRKRRRAINADATFLFARTHLSSASLFAPFHLFLSFFISFFLYCSLQVHINVMRCAMPVGSHP